jgi:hypothetical protein
LSLSIKGLLAIQQVVIDGQLHQRHRHIGRRPARAVLTQPLLHTGGVERAAQIEQGCQRRLHARLTLACRQVQDSQVFLGRPSRLPLKQKIVGHAETAGGEQVGTVTIVGECSRLADQPVDDVPVVDLVLTPAAQPGHLLHALLGVEEFDPFCVQPSLDPLADEPAGH